MPNSSKQGQMHDSSAQVAYQLLDEPLISVEIDGLQSKQTLPGLLACLSRAQGDVILTRLQAHQQHGMYAFMVQLAALGMVRTNRHELPHSEQDWREVLVEVAKEDGAGEEAYALVVKDLSKPAFFQPPVPEGTLKGFKDKQVGIDGPLDVLFTSKSVDVKKLRVSEPTPEDWIYALVVLQTMDGFAGRDNYGIVRMNGAYGSRPSIGFVPNYMLSSRFLRDVAILTSEANRTRLMNDKDYGKMGHMGLVWCKPWDGVSQLGMGELDPYFIETCRRVRLTNESDDQLVVHRATTKIKRINADELKGNTGDPWTPVSRKDAEALSVPDSGFTYTRVQDLMFGDGWEQGIAGLARSDRSDKYWFGQVLVRGQGKTGGYHERWVFIPPKVRGSWWNPDQRDKLRVRSKEWVDRAATARLKVLKPALLTLLQGAPEKDKLKSDDNRVNGYLSRFEAAIDDLYFPLLFEYADAKPEIADQAFEQALSDLAYQQLDDAVKSLPVPSARRWRAETQAYQELWWGLKKHFELLKSSSNQRVITEDETAVQGEQA